MARRALPLAAALLSLTLAAPAAAPAAETQPPPYLDELVRAARAQHLADTREWRVLMHYRPTLLGGYESEVDGADFFNAPDGKKNPEAELEATLAAFFAPLPDDLNVQHPQCRFIARYTWLNARLHFDPERMTPQVCARFHRWIAAIRPDTVVLVFPSAYLNSPPSMFGHTLFRLDQTGRPELLDYALNYAAAVPEDGGGSLYALKGLLGFFPGQFTLLPYYAKVQAYGEIENRDLWEYRLNLTPEQVERMLMHTWELGPTYFDYFFTKENCSYHLLSLLEAANPDLHLTDRFHVWTVPTDTLRAVEEQPGLVASVGFRPSRATLIRFHESRLGVGPVRLARRVATGKVAPDDAAESVSDPSVRARMLDLSDDYLLFAQAENDPPDPTLSAREQAVLVARSKVDAPPDDTPVPVPAIAPHEGHGTQRMVLGWGARDGSPFVQVGYRTAYHDLLDPDPGYDPLGQLQVLSGDVRFFPEQGRAELHDLTVLDIFSLAPWEGVFRERSWKVHAGWESRRTGDCVGCGAADFNFGPGLSARLGGAVVYAFIDLDAFYAHGLVPAYAVGPGVEAGVLASVTRAFKVHASAGYRHYWPGDAFGERRFAVAGRLALGRDAALRLTVSGSDAPFRSTTEGVGEVDLYW
jgi:hypothetical protein